MTAAQHSVQKGFIDPPNPFDTLQNWKAWEKEVSGWPAHDPDRQAYLKEARQVIRQKTADAA